MKKSAMKKVLVIGSTVTDIIIELDRLSGCGNGCETDV